jgi:hypothetical protein
VKTMARRRFLRWTAVIGASVIVLSGIAYTLANPFTPRDISGRRASTSPSTTPTATPDRETATPERPNPLGATLAFFGDTIEIIVTVFAVDHNSAPDKATPFSRGHWVSADIETCVQKSDMPFTADWYAWSVVDANSGDYDAGNVKFSAFRAPQFPHGETVAVGDCVRGWVSFPVIDGVDITKVKFQPNTRVSAEWSAA